MRIGIDGTPLTRKISGIGRVVLELCKEIDTMLPNAQFYIYSKKPLSHPLINERWISRVDSCLFNGLMKDVMWLKGRTGFLCKKDKLDGFWATNTMLPILPPGIRTVTIVYDLNYKIVPETMGTAALWARRLFFKGDVRKANTVLAISEGTSERLHQLFGRRADAVIPMAISRSFKPQSIEAVKESLNFYKIHDPYLLSVATMEPRKNLELLVNTFIDMKAEGLLPRHKLVLAGSDGWKDKRIRELISKYRGNSIIPLGYVRDEYLPALYAGADVFVFPSKYEGFGLPVLEARACGTRVVATDIPELREAGGSEAIYISPTSEGLAKGILAALTHEKEKGEDVSTMTSWEGGAKILAEAMLGGSR